DISDVAGNRGQVRWNLTVDTQAPRLDGLPVLRIAGGWAAARPGSEVTLQLNASDVHGVAGAQVDLAPLGGDLVSLAGPDPWQSTFRVPANASAGTHWLPIWLADGAGNKGVAARVLLAVDRTPPRILDMAPVYVGLTNATVRASVDEPSTMEVRSSGSLLASTRAAALRHGLAVGGLAPGRTHVLEVRAIDAAGNQAVGEVQVRTREDTTPPSAARRLTAFSEEEGIVELQWEPAEDNAGIAAYVVARTGEGPAMETVLPANASAYRDAAPPGASVTYNVTPMDLAGLRGPPAVSEVVVLALPRLGQGAITPERGTTADPFTVSVVYRNPSGRPADRVELWVGNTSHPLQFQGGDCRTGCAYVAEVHLPSTSLTLPVQASLRASADGRTAELAIGMPAVRLAPGAGAAHSGQPAPLPAAALQALALLSLAFLWRRTR
ncbi:MAG TPA: hypothetical protein VHI93_01110, partial [Candidatus Thermoplasmatota archaeon]|nr:hypothetical protein [Candidatus Thermoplasmatota archaeon]